jgi:mRNA interferase RelE/StbE
LQRGEAGYKVEFTQRAYKEYPKLEKVIAQRILEGINSLSSDPYLGKVLRGELKDKRSLRVGDYRVVYKIERERSEKVIILAIGHRREVY